MTSDEVTVIEEKVDIERPPDKEISLNTGKTFDEPNYHTSLLFCDQDIHCQSLT
jgi:hypothetical protein